MQMHTVMSEGSGNLSGGPQQRLAIAQALVLKPRILLFDGATSALAKLKVTRIVIVLRSGCVVQQGSFEGLASVEGLFAQLMARQMTLYMHGKFKNAIAQKIAIAFLS
jgi:ABC-type bacteriocin/lantibiotic exporter with double-glycine peptidase domain